MKIKYGFTVIMATAVLVGLTGCGAKTTTAVGATPNTSSQSPRSNFQPKLQLTTNPSPPAAGKKFTIKVTMQFRGGFRGSKSNSTGSGRSFKKGTGSSRGNFTNSSGRIPGNQSKFHQSNMTAVISGQSLKQSIPLTFNQGDFNGSTTIQKKGSYTVQVTMSMGSRNIKQSFTLKVQ